MPVVSFVEAYLASEAGQGLAKSMSIPAPDGQFENDQVVLEPLVHGK